MTASESRFEQDSDAVFSIQSFLKFESQKAE